MNLKGRYDMVRQAMLQMVGIPTDNLGSLKKMAVHMQIPAMHDADAAVSLLVLQTLIATHDGNTGDGPAFIMHVKDGDWTGTYDEWRARGVQHDRLAQDRNPQAPCRTTHIGQPS